MHGKVRVLIAILALVALLPISCYLSLATRSYGGETAPAAR